jgi:thymidylate synthase ThyX
MKFLSPEPQVVLYKSFPNAFKSIISAERTCYSAKGIISDEQLDPMEKWLPLARSMYEAGHHTNFQHANFQFQLSNVSRQCIWSLLHSHPFYNSEQISQRYVQVKPGNAVVPPLEGNALALYTSTVNFQVEAYHMLIELLTPVTSEEYFKRFPGRRRHSEKYQNDIKKKCQEIARYVLPVATFAYMYHTISGITLVRYHRLCEQYDAPHEQRMVIRKMVDELLRTEPLYTGVLEEPIPLEATPEYEFFTHQYRPANILPSRKIFCDEFDRSLAGRVSKLVDYKHSNETILADSVREILGVPLAEINDDDAIALVLHPAKNRLLGETLTLTTQSKLGRAMFHPSYTFRRKISHAADSQDQRHRMTPASRPCLHAHFTGEPDYVLPELIRLDDKALKFYCDAMERVWSAINTLKNSYHVSDEFALYLLPNAVSIRYTESADLLNLHHKLKMRLCYNAQEEIWKASLDEAEQIRDVNPRIGKFLLPPCSVRDLAGTHPLCPEGNRYCGIKVWRLDISEYERVI